MHSFLFLEFRRKHNSEEENHQELPTKASSRSVIRSSYHNQLPKVQDSAKQQHLLESCLHAREDLLQLGYIVNIPISSLLAVKQSSSNIIALLEPVNEDFSN